jgi:peptide/nickel transport system substrate-binding protein
MRVRVVSFAEPGSLLIARYFGSLLRRLGYRSSLEVLPEFSPDYLAYVANSTNRAQLGQLGWFADFLAPSTFMVSNFSCAAFVPESSLNANWSQTCDPALDARMERAGAIQTSDPAAANDLWAEIDRALVDQAATVPFATPHFVMLVSERVGNYRSHPMWGPLLDQLWVQ